MIPRLWYAQLDVYDTIRRYIAILATWRREVPSRDRLFVTDFYLASPCLLHFTHMTADVRRVFSNLNVIKPSESFIHYPSPTLLYQKMSSIQSHALHNVVGRGLVNVDAVLNDKYELSPNGLALAKRMGEKLVLTNEKGVLDFLTTEFATLASDKRALRAVTGLRRVGT